MSDTDLADRVAEQLINGPATLNELADAMGSPLSLLLVALTELQRGGFAHIRAGRWELTEAYKRKK
jgi:hypothetical protein